MCNPNRSETPVPVNSYFPELQSVDEHFDNDPEIMMPLNAFGDQRKYLM